MSKFGETLVEVPLPFLAQRVVWSPDGRLLACYGLRPTSVWPASQRLAVLDAATGAVNWEIDVLDVGSVAFRAHTQSLAVAGRLGRVEEITEFVDFLDCNEFPPQSRKDCERFNQEKAGKPVISLKIPPYQVSLLDAESGAESWAHEDTDATVRQVVFSSDGRLVAASGEKALRVINAQTGTVLLDPDVFTSLLVTAFSPDTRFLAVAEASRVVLLDIADRKMKWSRTLPGPVTGFVFTEDGRGFVVCTARQVFVLDIAAGGVQASVVLQEPLQGGTTVLGPGGRQLARTGQGTLVSWEAADGTRRFEIPVGDSAQARFNPVTPELAIASAAGVKVVNSKVGSTVWEGAAEPLTDLAFAADGRRLALCGGASWDSAFLRVHDMDPASVAHRVLPGR